MNQQTLTEARKRWQAHCEDVAALTPLTVVNETKAQQNRRVARLLKNYEEFVAYYFPHYAKCACGDFHIQAARKVLSTPNLKGVFQWARGHAKSTHFDIMIPLWLKAQNPRQLNVMVLVGKSQDNADTLLSDLQAELQYNQRYLSDFGQQVKAGSWENGQFVTADGCAFFSRGRGQSPRGLRYRDKRPDYIVIDDLDDDELCQNEERVRRLTDWVKEALFGALDAGRGRFIMVGNLISKNSVLANIAKSDGVFLSRTNVLKPDGTPSWPEKLTPEDVDEMSRFMGYRAFQKEMMNNPITEGAVFHNNWIAWKKPLPLRQYDQLVAYCDPSFKSSSKNDYKAIKLWGKSGNQLHHIDAFVRQTSVAEMVRWFYDLHERLPEGTICDYYIEANFLQDIILDEFTTEGNLRGYQLPIRADHRKKPDKFQRIEAISPLWERGFVSYNIDKQTDRDMLAGIEQLLAFEKGSHAHDDAPDADEGAIYILQKRTRVDSFRPVIGRRSSPSNAW
jgi:predicted phage terminase large subunit-like protein